MDGRRARKKGDGREAPPFPATAWGDEAEFSATWGKDLDEVIEACSHDLVNGSRARFDSDEEMLEHLRSLMTCRA